MKIFISTSSLHKEKELSKYFKDIGLKTTHILYEDIETAKNSGEDYICVREQTFLVSKSTGEPSKYDKFEEVVHQSTVTLEVSQGNVVTTKHFPASVDGFIFPNLKTDREGVYNWDEIFVSARTMKSYQEMKDHGIKNSARDLAFSQVTDELSHVFNFDKKINLNFNPIEINEVISFEPFIHQLFQENEYYKVAYKNPVFKNIVNYVMNEGLFIRRAGDRKQKNYWLPGLNAGIPLTPKKDALHELTFMFHDIMHFIYPDVMVTNNDPTSRKKYIISRMMSEAFTIVLADMLFISLLKDEGVEYDYEKRKIYPVFKQCQFPITKENVGKIEELLWANVCFALLGEEEPLANLVNDAEVMANYKHKYQRFFQEDYRWTAHNFDNVSHNYQKNKRLVDHIYGTAGEIVPETGSFAPTFNPNDSLKDQVYMIFKNMFSKLETVIKSDIEYNKELAFSNAVKRYFSGQIGIFFKFETLYNDLFLKQISHHLSKSVLNEQDLAEMKALYSVYIDKLKEDNYISNYTAQGFKNICPMFDPFYVFYEKKEEETFSETLTDIFQI